MTHHLPPGGSPCPTCGACPTCGRTPDPQVTIRNVSMVHSTVSNADQILADVFHHLRLADRGGTRRR